MKSDEKNKENITIVSIFPLFYRNTTGRMLVIIDYGF